MKIEIPINVTRQVFDNAPDLMAATRIILKSQEGQWFRFTRDTAEAIASSIRNKDFRTDTNNSVVILHIATTPVAIVDNETVSEIKLLLSEHASKVPAVHLLRTRGGIGVTLYICYLVATAIKDGFALSDTDGFVIELERTQHMMKYSKR